MRKFSVPKPFVLTKSVSLALEASLALARGNFVSWLSAMEMRYGVEKKDAGKLKGIEKMLRGFRVSEVSAGEIKKGDNFKFRDVTITFAQEKQKNMSYVIKITLWGSGDEADHAPENPFCGWQFVDDEFIRKDFGHAYNPEGEAVSISMSKLIHDDEAFSFGYRHLMDVTLTGDTAAQEFRSLQRKLRLKVRPDLGVGNMLPVREVLALEHH